MSSKRNVRKQIDVIYFDVKCSSQSDSMARFLKELPTNIFRSEIFKDFDLFLKSLEELVKLRASGRSANVILLDYTSFQLVYDTKKATRFKVIKSAIE